MTVTLTEHAEDCRLELYNVEGRQVAALDMASSTATLDLQDQPSGVYLLKLFTPKGTAVRKLVVR